MATSKKDTPKKTKDKAYDASSISVLEGLEPVRKRPGMYIGTTGPDGLHHLIWEIFDNSRDEAMGGFANRVEVALLPDNYIRVVDNGRGIPVDIHPKTKVSALETVMTTLHAGGRATRGGGHSGEAARDRTLLNRLTACLPEPLPPPRSGSQAAAPRPCTCSRDSRESSSARHCRSPPASARESAPHRSAEHRE